MTPETFHVDMLPLNLEADANMCDMSVTPETFQDERSPLNVGTFSNMCDMSVTLETSHDDMLPLNLEADANMYLASVTSAKSGMSVALYAMFDASLNASFIDVHDMPPHCIRAVTFWALVLSSPNLIVLKSPDMDTLYDPAEVYAWVALPDSIVIVSSPQSTTYVPV